jgi:ferrous iron transport protein B
VSTFAMMLKLLGRREALFSVALSVAAALLVALAVRLPMELLN